MHSGQSHRCPGISVQPGAAPPCGRSLESKGGSPDSGGYRAQCLSISGFKDKFPVNAKEKQDSFRQESIYQKTIQKSYFMVRHVPKTGNQEVFTGCPGGGQSLPLPTDSSSLICYPKPLLPGRCPQAGDWKVLLWGI